MSAAYREVVLASANVGKLLELRALLGDLPISLRSAAAFPEILFPEEGDSYEANAVAKARAAARDTGRLAVADDSGLEVDALGGAPGPRSARYGGSELHDAGRCAKLLEALAGVPPERRGARFVCVAALATPEGDVATARGECPGRILESPRGGGGFGYDPIFAPEAPELGSGARGRSMAELSAAEKHRISHRGRAFRRLAEEIRKRL